MLAFRSVAPQWIGVRWWWASAQIDTPLVENCRERRSPGGAIARNAE
jgi:hypothetical protein